MAWAAITKSMSVSHSGLESFGEGGKGHYIVCIHVPSHITVVVGRRKSYVTQDGDGAQEEEKGKGFTWLDRGCGYFAVCLGVEENSNSTPLFLFSLCFFHNPPHPHFQRPLVLFILRTRPMDNNWLGWNHPGYTLLIFCPVFCRRNALTPSSFSLLSFLFR